MYKGRFGKTVFSGFLLLTSIAIPSSAQKQRRRSAPPSPQTAMVSTPPTHANILRGEYGRYRANNDLLNYDLDIRVDPEKKFVSGRNTIRFKMLKSDNRIQLDLYDNLKVDKIVLAGKGQRAEGKEQRAKRRTPSTNRSSTNATQARSSSTFPIFLKPDELIRSTSITPARRKRLGALAASPLARTRLGGRGSLRLVKAKAPASGGPTRTSGKTKSSR
jgi:hypothetical protein